MSKSRSFFLALIIVLPFSLQAQKSKTAVAVEVPEIPVDSITKLISYKQVENVPGVSAADLYNRAMAWLNAYYKNPGDVLREKDPAAGKMVIKARYKMFNEPSKEGVAAEAGDVMYTLTLEFKDNRYRYEMTKFNWMTRSAFPAERWMDTSASAYLPAYAGYLKQVDEKSAEVLDSLRKKMSAVPVKVNNDW